MRIEHVIGKNIQRIRKSRGMNQSALGQAIGNLLGNAWSVQIVSVAESGKRSYVAAEMLAICRALDCTISDLLVDQSGQPVSVSDNFDVHCGELRQWAGFPIKTVFIETLSDQDLAEEILRRAKDRSADAAIERLNVECRPTR